ncbi:MAG: SH3 domain-containing protein [Rhodospirillales bacterium]|nr:SH3 domain-containing protein [Rhodospirillales bacterium]
MKLSLRATILASFIALFSSFGFGTGLFLGPNDSFAAGKGTGLPLPRFVSLRANEVNMRAGPSVRYPVEWVYKRNRLPVEIIAEFDTWRKIRDSQGGQGWVHKSMLSATRTFISVGKVRTLRAKADTSSAAVAKVEPNVVGRILECPLEMLWCRVVSQGYEGWLRRGEFWGVYRDEKIK